MAKLVNFRCFPCNFGVQTRRAVREEEGLITIKNILSIRKKSIIRFLALGAALLLFMFFVQFIGISKLNILILIFIFAGMGLAWSLSVEGGQFSWGNAIFFGIGAYTTMMTLIFWHITPWLSILLGSLFAASLGAAISFFGLRMEKAAFALLTYTMALLFQLIFINWETVGGGSGITLPSMSTSLFMMYTDSVLINFYIVASLLLLELVIIFFIRRSKMHLALLTIADDPTAAEARGVNVARTKIITYAISAGLTAIFGTFYVMNFRYVDPYVTFNFAVSGEIIIVAMIGGVAYLLGPIIGALIYVSLSQYLRVYFAGSYAGLDIVVLSILFAVIVVRSRGGVTALIDRLYRGIKSWFSRLE